MYKSDKENEKTSITKVPANKEVKSNSQKSSQENIQDLDQEQNVNPVQFTSQNIQIVVGDKKNNYSGKISGTTYLERYNKIVSDVIVWLFFGNDNKMPVCKTISDKNGKFILDNIPPGYYTIKAYLEGDYIYSSHYIRVLPCENIDHSIFLKFSNKKRDNYYNQDDD